MTNLPSYALDTLMQETRRLAATYRRQTGQALPVSSELARYDVGSLFALHAPKPPIAQVDFIGQGQWDGQNILVKSRVLFKHTRRSPQIGNIDMNAAWDMLFLVLYNNEYEPYEIWGVSKAVLSEHLHQKYTIGSIKNIGSLIWHCAPC